jgi:hypothetical protein
MEEIKINTHGLLILKPTKTSMRSFTKDELNVCKKALKKYWKTKQDKQ